VAQQTLKEMGLRYSTTPFSVNGSDERQLQSPAFRIPTVNITRGPYYNTDWYHNSKDTYRDKNSFLSLGESQLNRSAEVYFNVLMNLDRNRRIYSLNTHGEPQLGKRGLYPSTGGRNETDQTATIAKWIMHEDGRNLLDVAQKNGFSMKDVYSVYQKLERAGLVR
jgi:aminopeptidase-like protein